MTRENENNFTEILDELAKALSCEPLCREEDGRVLFALDDELGVALFTTDAQESKVDAVVAVIVLGPAPDDNAPFMRRLLCANYLGGDTADGTLAIDEEAGCLAITRVFEMPMDVSAFMDGFARLANAARHWADQAAQEFAVPEKAGEPMMKV